MTRFCTLLFLFYGFGFQHAPHRETAVASDPELKRLTAALDVAMTQTDINLASKKISEYWDAKLAAVEKRVEKKLDVEQRRRFSESKERWRSYRMQEVEFRTDFFAGGSIQPLVANMCYAEITEHRVTGLLSLLLDALEGREDQPSQRLLGLAWGP